MPDETVVNKERILSVDLLRGIVMIIMLLDHTRDFMHAGAFLSDPTDPATTTVPVFFTRWITHFCAPAFVFLSGVSIYLQKMYGKSNAELSRFLLTRGLWLIFLEFTIVRFGIVFNFDYSFFGMAQVIWVIGVSMIVMAGLIYLPVKLVGAVGLVMILLHNLFDGIRVPPEIAFAATPPPDLGQALWIVLHQPGVVPLADSGSAIFFAYPLIPWIGVMALGFAAGMLYGMEAERRRKVLLAAGLAATAGFLIIRFINIYGDPAPWSSQANGTAATVLSFLNTTKYPPSLLFLLMTLGPSLILLSLTDGVRGNSLWQRVAIVFGRVPMFFYILQWFVAHGFSVLLGLLFGKDVGYLFRNLFEMGQSAPPGSGFPLWVVYAAWIVGLLFLYPLCKWYGDYKRRNKHWALSYL